MKKILSTLLAGCLSLIGASAAVGPGSGTNRLYISYTAGNNANYIEVAADNALGQARISSGLAGATKPLRPLVLSGNGTTLMLIINTNGNIGISTNNPQERLHVHGNMLVASNAAVLGTASVGSNYVAGGSKTDGIATFVSDANIGGAASVTGDIVGYGNETVLGYVGATSAGFTNELLIPFGEDFVTVTDGGLFIDTNGDGTIFTGPWLEMKINGQAYYNVRTPDLPSAPGQGLVYDDGLQRMVWTNLVTSNALGGLDFIDRVEGTGTNTAITTGTNIGVFTVVGENLGPGYVTLYGTNNTNYIEIGVPTNLTHTASFILSASNATDGQFLVSSNGVWTNATITFGSLTYDIDSTLVTFGATASPFVTQAVAAGRSIHAYTRLTMGGPTNFGAWQADAHFYRGTNGNSVMTSTNYVAISQSSGSPDVFWTNANNEAILYVIGTGGETNVWMVNGFVDSVSNGGATPPPVPMQVGGLLGWWSARSLTGTNDGDVVSSWTDIANGYSLTNAIADRAPVFRTNAIGVQPALNFTETYGTNWLELPIVTNFQPWVAFAVFKHTNIPPDFEIMFESAAASASEEKSYFGRNSGSSGILNAGSSVTYSGQLSNVAYIASLVYTGATSSIRTNGAFAQTLNPGTNAFVPLRLGSRYNLLYPFKSYLSEILIYTNAVSASDITNIENYLESIYDIVP